MCCIAELICLVFGIVVLATGKIKLTGSRIVKGVPARIIGVLLLLPLVLGTGGAAIYGAMVSFQAAQANPGNPPDTAALAKQLETPVLIINIVGGGIPLVAAFILALVNAKPGEKPRPKREEDEFDETDEDRPRRRRRADDVDKDDAPPDDRIERR
jgi:hypothetical protein